MAPAWVPTARGFRTQPRSPPTWQGPPNASDAVDGDLRGSERRMVALARGSISFEPISGQNFPSSSPLISATPSGHVAWVLVVTVVIAVRVASVGALKPSSSPPSPLSISPVAPL